MLVSIEIRYHENLSNYENEKEEVFHAVICSSLFLFLYFYS